MNRIDHIGLQLYTVREEMAGSFEDTLKKVAAIGYKDVEFAGYFDRTPKEVRRTLNRYGLTASILSAISWSFSSSARQAIEETSGADAERR